MCEICRKYLCPPGCPSFVGYSAERGRRLFRCEGCGSGIYEDDDYIYNYGKPYCLSCITLCDNDEEQKDRGEKWKKISAKRKLL